MVVRRFRRWGSAYQEAVFRLADHAQSAAEQDHATAPESEPPVWVSRSAKGAPPEAHALPLTGLDGSNPLAFLAALGALVACDRLGRAGTHPDWLPGTVSLSWGCGGAPDVPVLHFPRSVTPDELVAVLAAGLERDLNEHPAAWVVRMLEAGLQKGADRNFDDLARRARPPHVADRFRLGWVTALSCESVLDADSQLQTVRCDYLIDNLRAVLARCEGGHLRRSLFAPWDYADGLSNQSLHWEPSEDRRHAYQWEQPSGDPTRKRRGGMLGANRLAVEAWPLFPSFADGDRVRTRGFRGTRATDTYWSWPLWGSRLTADGVASMLGVAALLAPSPDATALPGLGVTAVFRSQRILVGKTPNLTPSESVFWRPERAGDEPSAKRSGVGGL